MGVNAVFVKLPSKSGIPVFCPCWLLPINPKSLFVLGTCHSGMVSLSFWSLISIFTIVFGYLDYLHGKNCLNQMH